MTTILAYEDAFNMQAEVQIIDENENFIFPLIPTVTRDLQDNTLHLNFYRHIQGTGYGKIQYLHTVEQLCSREKSHNRARNRTCNLLVSRLDIIKLPDTRMRYKQNQESDNYVSNEIT